MATLALDPFSDLLEINEQETKSIISTEDDPVILTSRKKMRTEWFIDGPNFMRMQLTYQKMADYYQLLQKLKQISKIVEKVHFFTMWPRSRQERHLAECLTHYGYDVVHGEPHIDIDLLMRAAIAKSTANIDALGIFTGDGGYRKSVLRHVGEGREIWVFSSQDCVNGCWLEKDESLPLWEEKVKYFDPFGPEWETIYQSKINMPLRKKEHINKFKLAEGEVWREPFRK
jgi:hypothetical protein